MSEYTPTTEQVRIYYANDGLDEERLREEVYLLQQAKLEKEFDRWLAQHEAEMVARTLNAVSAYLYEADLVEAVSQGRVSLIFNELTDDEWLDWLDDAESLIKREN